MFPDETITISYPENPEIADYESTWESFVSHNDPEIVADVLRQLVGNHYAAIGGGSEPLVWIFA